jgi:hypothetical protein
MSRDLEQEEDYECLPVLERVAPSSQINPLFGLEPQHGRSLVGKKRHAKAVVDMFGYSTSTSFVKNQQRLLYTSKQRNAYCACGGSDAAGRRLKFKDCCGRVV